MKKLKQVKTGALAVIALLLLHACTENDKSNLLVKTWRVDDLQYSQEIPSSLKPTVENWVHSMRDSFTLSYLSNGTYTTKLGNQTLMGTWKLNRNSTRITSTGSDGVAKEYKILTLTDSKFSFEATGLTEKVVFVMVPVKQ